MIKKPIVSISIGCPSGIGPEIALTAASREKEAKCVLVGDMAVLLKAAKLRRVASKRLIPVQERREMEALLPGQIGVYASSSRIGGPSEFQKPNREGGAAQFAWINEAASLVKSGQADALVTGPVSKYAIATSLAPGSADFLGHTEHLARLFGAREVVMAFWSEKLTSSLVTTHLPLSQVPLAISPEAVAQSTYWLSFLLYWLGKNRPKVAVASLNPHAGEGGLLGNEECDRIVPGIQMASGRLKEAGLMAELLGPMGAETAFRRAVAGDFDGVVAMYHDQATIPSKLMSFGDAVNITLGLPIVRTSVDHGTAYDLAGTGKADARAMRAAIFVAIKLIKARSSDPSLCANSH